MESFRGITLDRIVSEYKRPKVIPTSLAQVADMLGVDYLEMMDFIRDAAPEFDFHTIDRGTCQRLGIPLAKRADYMLDYYLGAESSMNSLAVLFDYSAPRAVRRILNESTIYQERVKHKRQRKARERIEEIRVKIPAAIKSTKLSVFETNKVLLQFCEAKLPVFTDWPKVTQRYYALYPPIYKKACNFAKQRNISLDDLISTAILKCHLGAKK